MLNSIKFFHGFLLGAFALGIVFLAAHVLLLRVGEIGLDSIVSRQLSDTEDQILYSSGLNQFTYYHNYKLKLLDRSEPEVIALGSSRAMEVREQFFERRFTNLGGLVTSIAELEAAAEKLGSMQYPPKLGLLFIDFWWFNKQVADQVGSHQLPQFPDMISAGLAFSATTAFQRGNWVSAAFKSKHLGIHAILTGDGFSKDGSYHYVSNISGNGNFHDIQFSTTFALIDESQNTFAKNDRADPDLVMRACSAISKIRQSGVDLVLIAPPFSDAVWAMMRKGGYDYIDDAFTGLAQCSNGIDFYNFSSATTLQGSTDCEFIDGRHGGDVTYARILKAVAQNNEEVKKYLAVNPIDEFIQRNSGYAGGITRNKFLDGKEVDFLKIGCRK